MFWFYLSLLLLILQAAGILYMLRSLYHIIQALSQHEGIAEVRGQLWHLFRPLLLGVVSIALLMSSIFIDHLGGVWLKFLAPSSTIIWMLWVQRKSSHVLSGTLFNTLVPLVRYENTLPLAVQKDIEALTWSWVEQLKKNKFANNMSAPAFLKSVMYAIECGEKHLQKDFLKEMSITDLIHLVKEILHDFHSSVLLFPLSQKLTLADWISEGRHFHQHAQQGLSYYAWGRALINPFSLLDHKHLWQAAGVKQNDLIQQEFVAWLHAGIYRLSLHHLCLYAQRKLDVQHESEHFQNSPLQFTQLEDVVHNPFLEKEGLWQLLTIKLKIPMRLYLIVGLGACCYSFPWWLSAIGGSLAVALYLWSEKTTFNLSRWQQAFSDLAQTKEDIQVDEEKLHLLTSELQRLLDTKKEYCVPKDLLKQWTDYTLDSLKKTIDQYHPHITQDLSAEERQNSMLYWQVENCELYIPDLIALAYYICDDFLIWYQKGGFWSKALKLSETVGFSLSRKRLDQVLIQFLHEIAHTHHEKTDEMKSEQEEQKDSSLNQIQSYIQQGDEKINHYIPQGGFTSPLIHKGIEWILEKGLDWLHEELTERVIPLYTGQIEPLAKRSTKSDQTSV